MQTQQPIHASENAPSSKADIVSDLIWLIAIAAVMATAGIWSWLSPRPEIGQVAVLWLPNAILTVALLRNWGRPVFCVLAILIFIGVGIFPAFATDTVAGALALLTVDIMEVGILAFGLILWFGPMFRLNSSFDVTAFGVVATASSAFGGFLAAIVSQIPLGATVIDTQAPLQVGVAWFTSDLATYLLVAAPIIALTGRGGRHAWTGIAQSPILSILGGVLVMVLTFIGFTLPQWLAAQTGLALGSGGLILIAFPLATYLGFTRGPVIAALVGSAIGFRQSMPPWLAWGHSARVMLRQMCLTCKQH